MATHRLLINSSCAAAGRILHNHRLVIDSSCSAPGSIWVFHRLLMHCFDIFCRAMELVLRAETKVANFVTPGPAVNALEQGISEVSSYFYDDGNGLPERVIDAQIDEYSRLSQLLDLHRVLLHSFEPSCQGNILQDQRWTNHRTEHGIRHCTVCTFFTRREILEYNRYLG